MYSSKLTAALTGASLGQLAYWRRHDATSTPILTPEYGTDPRALYSFADVVALRMFVRLRRDTSLQKVRRAVDMLRKYAPDSHLSTHRMKSAGRTIVWLTDDGEFVDLVERGQGDRGPRPGRRTAHRSGGSAAARHLRVRPHQGSAADPARDGKPCRRQPARRDLSHGARC